MSTIKISVIIPHYNSETELKKLLNTIPIYNKEIEVIVIDDKSSDQRKLEKLRQEFKDVIFKKNSYKKKGAGVSRNIGLEFAKGEWLVFADSDDYFLPDSFNIFFKFTRSQADVIFFNPRSYNWEKNIIGTRHSRYSYLVMNYLRKKDIRSEEMLRAQFVTPWSKMIKRSLIKKNNVFFQEVEVSNDVMFSAKVGYYAKKIEASKEIVYVVTETQGTLTKRRDYSTFKLRFDVFILYNKFLRNKIAKRNRISGISFILKSFRYGLKVFAETTDSCVKNKVRLTWWPKKEGYGWRI